MAIANSDGDAQKLALQLHSTLKCLLVATFRGRFRQLPLNILSRSTVQL